MKAKKMLSGLTSLALSLSAFAGIGAADAIRPTDAKAASGNWKFDFGGSGAAGGTRSVGVDGLLNAAMFRFLSRITAARTGAAFAIRRILQDSNASRRPMK